MAWGAGDPAKAGQARWVTRSSEGVKKKSQKSEATWIYLDSMTWREIWHCECWSLIHTARLWWKSKPFAYVETSISFGSFGSSVVQDLRLLRCNMAIHQLVPVSANQPNILAVSSAKEHCHFLTNRSPVDAAGPWLNSQRRPQQHLNATKLGSWLAG